MLKTLPDKEIRHVYRERVLTHVCAACNERVDKLCLLEPRLSFVTMNAELLTTSVYRSQ